LFHVHFFCDAAQRNATGRFDALPYTLAKKPTTRPHLDGAKRRGARRKKASRAIMAGSTARAYLEALLMDPLYR
jgi:hypothetical protein